MIEQQKQTPELSSVVQQTIGKLNVCMADLLEQINSAIKVLIKENMMLQAKLDNTQSPISSDQERSC